jgi:hypothetical protein
LALSGEVASWTYGLPDTSHTAGQAGTTNLGDGSQNTVVVYGVGGTTEANGTWTYTVFDSTHIDLVGSTFTHAYTSGGKIGGAIDSVTISLDAISVAAQTQLSGASSTNTIGFFTGSNLAATLQTAEQGDPLARVRVRALRPVTDAPATAAVVYRETLQASALTSSASSINASGICPVNISTRYARGQMSVPYGAAWTFASGMEPVISREGQQ